MIKILKTIILVNIFKRRKPIFQNCTSVIVTGDSIMFTIISNSQTEMKLTHSKSAYI